MKRILFCGFAGAMLAGLVTLSVAQSESSLGDYARAQRKENKPTATKKFDNDNLPATEKLSVIGTAKEDPSQAAALGVATGEQPAGQAQTQNAAKQPAEDWKGKIEQQKGKVDLLSRELDVAQREYRLRAAAMYADAGNRLRSQSSWDKEDADYKKQIEQRKQALDDAKKGLDDLQEQARKAGIPSKERQ